MAGGTEGKIWHREDLAAHSPPRPHQPPTGTGAAVHRGSAPLPAPSCFRGRPGTRSASPWGWGSAPQLARKPKPAWREAASENLFPKWRNPSDAWQLSPAPSCCSNTSRARLAPAAPGSHPAPWHSTKSFCTRSTSAPFSFCSLAERRCKQIPLPAMGFRAETCPIPDRGGCRSCALFCVQIASTLKHGI